MRSAHSDEADPPARATKCAADPPKERARAAAVWRSTRARSSSHGSGRGHPSSARSPGPSQDASLSADKQLGSVSSARFSPPARCSYSKGGQLAVAASASGQKHQLRASTKNRYCSVAAGSLSST